MLYVTVLILLDYNNSKVTDHHAILPTVQMNKNLDSLAEQERNILLMICVKLIFAVSEKHTFTETTLIVECNKEIFTSKGKIITVNGWKQLEETFTKAMSKNKKPTRKLKPYQKIYQKINSSPPKLLSAKVSHQRPNITQKILCCPLWKPQVQKA